MDPQTSCAEAKAQAMCNHLHMSHRHHGARNRQSMRMHALQVAWSWAQVAVMRSCFEECTGGKGMRLQVIGIYCMCFCRIKPSTFIGILMHSSKCPCFWRPYVTLKFQLSQDVLNVLAKLLVRWWTTHIYSTVEHVFNGLYTADGEWRWIVNLFCCRNWIEDCSRSRAAAYTLGNRGLSQKRFKVVIWFMANH